MFPPRGGTISRILLLLHTRERDLILVAMKSEKYQLDSHSFSVALKFGFSTMPDHFLRGIIENSYLFGTRVFDSKIKYWTCI